jgi:GNAT superfamily N-acetyltransferase
LAQRGDGPAVTLRPVTAQDEEFLCSVYASTRQEELAGVAWSEQQKAAFLWQQCSAQHHHYREHYTGATYDVIEVDGCPAGRLYAARWEHEIRIMDIALLPEHRGRGIGTVLLRQVLDEAGRTGRRVSIHVEKFNPARRLYHRLGFVETVDRGVYVLMVWPEGDSRMSPEDSLVPQAGFVGPDRHDEQVEAP